MKFMFKLLCYIICLIFSAIVVVQNATVLDLKRAIRRYVTLKLLRDGEAQPISWYVHNFFHQASL